jgi:hypothetical protein
LYNAITEGESSAYHRLHQNRKRRAVVTFLLFRLENIVRDPQLPESRIFLKATVIATEIFYWIAIHRCDNILQTGITRDKGLKPNPKDSEIQE